MRAQHAAAREVRATTPFDGPPPGWAGGRGELRWQALPAERRARIWAAHLGLTPTDVRSGRAVEDRDDARRLLRVVASHRHRLAMEGASTADADALLAKLSWGNAERRAA